MKKVFYILIALVLISCNRNETILGTWVRSGDPFEGMTVEVKRLDDNYVGIITMVNEEAKRHRYAIHDVKWKELTKINNNTYEFQDLRKGVYYGQTTFEYQDAFITMENSRTITIRQGVKGNETWGTYQLWHKKNLVDDIFYK